MDLLEINVLTEAKFQRIEPPDRCVFMRLWGFENLVDQIFPRWNPLASWMWQIADFHRAV